VGSVILFQLDFGFRRKELRFRLRSCEVKRCGKCAISPWHCAEVCPQVFSERRIYAPERWRTCLIGSENWVLLVLAGRFRAAGLNPSCRRAWLAFVSLRPVVLNLGV
jgi:hypothetical protein